MFYNAMPAEQDANAAAAMLLHNRYEEHVGAILESDEAALARSLTPPADLSTLLVRSVCFLYLFADVAADPSRSPSGLSFDRRLDHVAPGAGELWRALDSAQATLRRQDDR